MTGSSKVVVITTVEYDAYPDGLHTARFRPLGLTAYGWSRHDARSNFFTLLQEFIEDTRELGQLEVQLGRAGVAWHAAHDYVKSGQSYFDLETRSWVGAEQDVSGEKEPLAAMAA